MIAYCKPYSLEKNLGAAYNQHIKLLPNSTDWVCFIDADAMFLTSNFGHQIADIVKKYKECRFFTSLTNRVNCRWQIAPNVNKLSNDIQYHRELATELQQKHYDRCEDVTNKGLMSGVLMLVQKSLWEQVGGFKQDKMIGIDNDFHQKVKTIGEKLYLMNGVYVFHWYRNNNKEHSHLL